MSLSATVLSLISLPAAAGPREMPLKGPLRRTVLARTRLSRELLTTMPSPSSPSGDPTLSWTHRCSTRLAEPPSMTTPASKRSTVPFRTVAPLTQRNTIPGPRVPASVPPEMV